MVIMFQKSAYKNQQQPIILNKIQSSYKKLEKEMNKPPSEYEAIKKLIENNENDIKTFGNKSFKNVDKKVDKNVKIIPHKKK